MTKLVQLFSGLPQDQYSATSYGHTSALVSHICKVGRAPVQISDHSGYLEWEEPTRASVEQYQTLTRDLTVSGWLLFWKQSNCQVLPSPKEQEQ